MTKPDDEGVNEGLPSGEHEDESGDESYLWDRSAPESAEVAKLEALLSPFALRKRDASEVPLPGPLSTDTTLAPVPSPSVAPVAPRSHARSRPRQRLVVGGIVGTLALAAAATLGYFVGQSARPPMKIADSPTQLDAGTAILATTSSSETSSQSASPLVTPPTPGTPSCSASSPGGPGNNPSVDEGLGYEVLAGEATCGGWAGPKRGFLPLGMWLETDAVSRIMLDVADIGHVEISPRTRLRILPGKLLDNPLGKGKDREHRLELAHGMISARIDAPPRLFIVETGAGAAVDLGCAYTLEVGDDGVGFLRVGRGEVALERDGASVVVHRGEACEMRPGKGPGTPFPLDASAPFRSAVSAWDFETAPLAPVLDAATDRDALGLLGLLTRAKTRAEREKIAERLAKVVARPASVKLESLLRGDPAALADYRLAIRNAP